MVVVTGDTHLAPGAWASMPDVSGDSYDSFKQIVKFTIDSKATALVLAGDVFDAHPPAPTMYFFIEQMMLLESHKIPVYAVQGQHGRDRTMPWTSVYPYVRHLSGHLVEIEPKIFMTGFDNLPPDELKQKLETLDQRINILILHQMSRGAVPEIAGRQNWDFDPEWVPPTVDVVVLGDFHEPWEKKLERDQFLTRLYYTGSTCMQSTNEPPDKSFITIELEGDQEGEGLVIRRQPLVTRPFKKLTVLSEEVMDRAIYEMKQLEPNTLCHVRFDPRVVAVEARLRAVNATVHFKIEPLSIQENMETADLVPGGEVSLEGCLSQLVDRTTDSELYSFLWALLSSKEPKDTIHIEREKRLGSLEKITVEEEVCTPPAL